MNNTVGAAAKRGSQQALAQMAAVDSAAGEIDTADVFYKLVKKAEEAAQAAV